MGTRTNSSYAQWTRERQLLSRYHDETWRVRIEEAAGLKPAPKPKCTFKGELMEVRMAVRRELCLLLRELGRTLLKAVGIL